VARRTGPQGDGAYGWGKTKCYQTVKDHELVPPPVMIHPDRWRLDKLLAWRMALTRQRRWRAG
jgi:hypothetical protein